MASWRRPASAGDLPLFALVWLVCMVGFYSAAATKLAGYILPVVPAGVVLVGLLFQPLSPQPPLAFGARVTGWCNAAVLGLAAIAAAVLPRFLKQQPDYPSFVKALVHTGLPIWLPLVFLLTLVGLLWILSSNQALSLLWLPNATALSLLLAVAVPTILPVVDRERLQPIRGLGTVVGRLLKPNDRLVVVGFKRYSLLFYSDHPALFVASRQELFDAFPKDQAAGNIFLFGTAREFQKIGLNASACHTASCQIVDRRGAHLLIRSSLSGLHQVF
jgi:4-amino-4-deoxy-L-arabinose transferase-like glycosyltransferase